MNILMLVIAGMLLFLIVGDSRQQYVVTEVIRIPQSRSSGCLWFFLWLIVSIIFIISII